MVEGNPYQNWLRFSHHAQMSHGLNQSSSSSSPGGGGPPAGTTPQQHHSPATPYLSTLPHVSYVPGLHQPLPHHALASHPHPNTPLGTIPVVGGHHQSSMSKRKRSWSRAVFSNLQRKGLEKRFQMQKYITKPDRRQLAATLGLTDAQVRKMKRCILKFNFNSTIIDLCHFSLIVLK
jgi:hypothetical protein